MERSTFRSLLLRCAVLAMACDGELHDDELAEIRRMTTDLPHFAGTDPDTDIPRVLENLRSNGSKTFETLFEDLDTAVLKPHQRYLALEALLNVIGADGVFRPTETAFLRRTKNVLQVDDEAFIVRFPQYIHVVLSKVNEEDSTVFTPPTSPEKSMRMDFSMFSHDEDKREK